MDPPHVQQVGHDTQQPADHEHDPLQSTGHDLELGECVAVLSNKYNERPLLGRVTAIFDDEIQMDWMVGTYSGMWRDWKGRVEGKPVVFCDRIKIDQVVMRSIQFTNGKRLKSDTVCELKQRYSTHGCQYISAHTSYVSRTI